MRLVSATRLALALPFLFSLTLVVPGCGSGKSSDGEQLNVTIPAAEAKTQNDAYQQFSKQNKKRPTR